ncbi:STAS/SEC14 domain-containing protein [Salinisphaera sp. USBA-960]|uniref:STAS/SEC14 domain-containing protein n=1 Tax=Salinisphaera orenii TaxID=856731 RepID=UPI0013A61991|nr:STAS/SEC14 domain-containing protein [Salifodinibacter halophilus]
MIRILPFEVDFVLALAIDGPISSDDASSVIDAVEDRLERHNKLGVYVELHSLGGVPVRSMLSDLKRALKHWRQFNRLALVTDNRWLAKGGPLINRLFSNAKFGIYRFDDKADAIAWISEQSSTNE